MMPPGTTLSRWTMSYFGAAVLFLLLAEALLAAGWWKPSAAIAEPGALIVVHSFTIGWLGLLMIGALLQFTPVLTGVSLPTERLNLPCLIATIVGLCLLLHGFDRLDAGSTSATALFGAAGASLAASLLTTTALLFLSLWHAPDAHPAARFVMIGLVAFAVTILLGTSFALTLSGIAALSGAVEMVVAAMPFHAGFGLVGWMTFAAIGVTYKLLPMFLLASDIERPTLVCKSGVLALTLFAVAAVSGIVGSAWAKWLFVTSGVAFQFSITAYGLEVLELYRGRRRKELEPNTLGSIPAFAVLIVSAPIFVAAVAFDLDAHIEIAAAYLFAFGWLSGLGLAQLLKIVPFLTWIEAFGPLLGKRPTPRLSDLVNNHRSLMWLGGFYMAVLLASGAIALRADAVFQAAAAAQAVFTFALSIELLQARSLANVASREKAPPLRLPALFYVQNQTTR